MGRGPKPAKSKVEAKLRVSRKWGKLLAGAARVVPPT